MTSTRSTAKLPGQCGWHAPAMTGCGKVSPGLVAQGEENVYGSSATLCVLRASGFGWLLLTVQVCTRSSSHNAFVFLFPHQHFTAPYALGWASPGQGMSVVERGSATHPPPPRCLWPERSQPGQGQRLHPGGSEPDLQLLQRWSRGRLGDTWLFSSLELLPSFSVSAWPCLIEEAVSWGPGAWLHPWVGIRVPSLAILNSASGHRR